MNTNYNINNLFDFFEYWEKYTQPTEFYNEGWLLKLLVFSITDFGLKEHELYVDKKNKFFSEALLYSPFLARARARTRKDPFAENHTHADGAIGDFVIGNEKSKGSLHLIGNKFNVFEAKINSELSKDVTNAPFFDQAARYIACITETLEKSNKIETLDKLSLGFYLTVPEEKYRKKNSFEKCLSEENILKTVQQRVEQYKNEDDFNKRIDWFENKFTPVLKKIKIEPIFYETIISELLGYKYIDEIKKFYDLCLAHNK